MILVHISRYEKWFLPILPKHAVSIRRPLVTLNYPSVCIETKISTFWRKKAWFLKQSLTLKFLTFLNGHFFCMYEPIEMLKY